MKRKKKNKKSNPQASYKRALEGMRPVERALEGLRPLLQVLPPLTVVELEAAPCTADENSERILRFFQEKPSEHVQRIGPRDDTDISEVVRAPKVSDAVRRVYQATKAPQGSVSAINVENLEAPEAVANALLEDPVSRATIDSLPAVKFMDSVLAAAGPPVAVDAAQRRRMLMKLLAVFFYFAGVQGQLVPKAGAGGPESPLSEEERRSRAQFTADMMAAFQKALPDLRVEIKGDLELKLHTTDGREAVTSLHVPYRDYKRNPLEKEAILAHWVTGILAMSPSSRGDLLDRSRVLPLLKTNAWLEAQQAEEESKKSGPMERAYRRFNDDLVVVYVVDRPQTMAFLRDRNMADLGLGIDELHKLALDNLQGLFPHLVVTKREGVYRFTCGGNYDASLILLDGFCELAQSRVSGSVVVAVPAEDRLLAVGSEDPAAVEKLSQLAQEQGANALRPLSPKLLVRREGKWLPYST